MSLLTDHIPVEYILYRDKFLIKMLQNMP